MQRCEGEYAITFTSPFAFVPNVDYVFLHFHKKAEFMCPLESLLRKHFEREALFFGNVPNILSAMRKTASPSLVQPDFLGCQTKMLGLASPNGWHPMVRR